MNEMHCVFIFDMSGSMAGHEADVTGGFNTYVKDLPESRVSYVRFDTIVEKLWLGLERDQVPEMKSPDHYFPRGGTALFDAVGETITAIPDDPNTTFTVVIHTDGEENSSKIWTQEKVKDLIAEREALGNWTFVFFGQGFEQWQAEHVSAGMGMASGQTVAYAHGSGSLAGTSAGRATRILYASGGRSSGMMGQTVAAMNAAVADGAALSDAEVLEILTGKSPFSTTAERPEA